MKLSKIITFGLAMSLASIQSFVSAQESKITFGTGLEYFASDRVYDETGGTQVTGNIVFEFRLPMFAAYQFNRYQNFKLIFPYIYRKVEYSDGSFDRLGKGLGDIDISSEMLIKVETGIVPSLKAKSVLTIPTGKSNLKGSLGSNKMTTGGPLLGSQVVYKYGGTYNFDIALEVAKSLKEHTYLTNIGYKITLPVSANGRRINPGDLFHFGIGYTYSVNKETSIGLYFGSFSSGRTRIDGDNIDYTSGIIGKLGPKISVKLPNSKLNFALQIPIFGKNEYKGIGYSLIILF